MSCAHINITELFNMTQDQGTKSHQLS